MASSKQINYMAHTLESFRRHVGHIIGYRCAGAIHARKLLRVTWSDIGGEAVLWLEGKPFPLTIYGTEAVECSCGEGRKTETPPAPEFTEDDIPF